MQARGSAYYVDPAHFSDKEILARLAPEPAAEDAAQASQAEIEKVNKQ